MTPPTETPLMTYGELMMLCEGHGASPIYERFLALQTRLAAAEREVKRWKNEAAINAENFHVTNQALVKYDEARIAAERDAAKAREDALEEAACLCENKIQAGVTSLHISCANAAHENDARAIRALKDAARKEPS